MVDDDPGVLTPGAYVEVASDSLVDGGDGAVLGKDVGLALEEVDEVGVVFFPDREVEENGGVTEE